MVDCDGYAFRIISSRSSASAGLSLHNLDVVSVVTVALSSSDEGEATVSPATLTFTEDNWDTAQAVTVTGLDDNDTDGNRAYEVGLSAENVLTSVPEVTTFAGGSYGSQDGSGTEAYFSGPFGITTDGTNLYVADTSNNRIRKIDISTKEVSTLAGDGDYYSYDGNGTNSGINYPKGVATDGSNLYVAETGSNNIRRIDLSTEEVTTLAGSGTYSSSDGHGTEAGFMDPLGITIEGSDMYVADSSGNAIRKISLRGTVTAEDCAMTKLFCTEMLARVADQSIQTLGGMGPVSYTHLTLPTNREV